jgi:methionyl-tRNA formyltransferase
LKVLFFGYSQIGHRAVHLLAERGDEVLAVVTHRDDPHENRWYKTPAEAAAEHGFRVIYSEDLAEEQPIGPIGPIRPIRPIPPGSAEELAESLAPDLVLSVFYRDLLSERVLKAARLAALNLHPSLLPAYRGRAPINWVLVNGEKETGVTLHHMVGRADAGDIVAQRAIPIAPRDTALSLYLKVEQAGIEILAEALPLVEAGRAPRIPQDLSKSNYVGRRRPEDGRIDWSWPAERIDGLVRAVAPPWPGAFGDIEGRRAVIAAGEPDGPLPADRPAPGTVRREDGRLFVATGDRWFRIDSLQP